MKSRKSCAYTGIRMAPRLILLILFVLLTIIAVDMISRRFTTMPDVYLFEAGWLVDYIAGTREALEDSPQDRWRDILEGVSGTADWFDISVIPRQEFSAVQGALTETLTLFRQDLHARLGAKAFPVIGIKNVYGGFSRRTAPLTVITRQLPVRLIDELEDKGQGDVSISAHLMIYVPLANGDWLAFRTKSPSVSLLAYLRLFAAPVFGILMILLASAWTARSLLRPLQRLSAAAERMGRERHISAIPDMHIPEYRNIANAFSEMQVQLKRFVDERTHMLAAISHDIRTLLTRIQLLVDDIGDERKRRDILSNLSDMETMIKEYLLFARDDAVQEAYVQTDIASLLLSVCDTLQDAGHDVIYTGPDHAQIVCQPVAMRRVFLNLVENACKYGERADVILHDEKEAVDVAVADRGPGIPEDLMEQAFKPFQRLETSRNRDTGGTGLGLSIARDIVLAHGGEIRLSNSPAGGLSAHVTLPKPSQNLAREAQGAVPTVSSQRNSR